MKFKVGLVGCGTIFPMHAQSLVNIPGVEIAAVCDIRSARARSAAKKYACRAYTDYARMLKDARLDAVHILTPHYLHPPMSLQALNKKVHVLTEKPASINPADARKMSAAAEKNKVRLAVVFQNRFNPGSRLVKQNLENGRLGKVKAAKLFITYHKPDSYYRQSDWKGRLATEGGGVLIDQAIHYVDLLRWLIGSEVDFIEAHTARRRHQFIEVEDLAEGMIQFKSGAYACFYLMNFYSCDSDPVAEIDCQNGRVKIVKDSARINFYNCRPLEAKPDPGSCIDYGEGCRDYWGSCHWVQIREFYRALSQGRQPPVSPADAIKTQQLVWDIYRSAGMNGKRVYSKSCSVERIA